MWEIAITTSVLILLVLGLRGVCRGHISMRLQYGMWLLVAVKLLVFPVPWIESDFSVLKLFEEPGQKQHEVIVNDETVYEPMSGQEAPKGVIIGVEPEDSLGFKREEGIEAALVSAETTKFQEVCKGVAVIGTVVMLLVLVGYNLSFWCYLKRHRIFYEKVEDRLPVYLVEGMPSACLFGKGIYIAPEIVEDEKKKKHVLAHEYAHYKQGDSIWTWVRGICLACYWWNPVVWVAAYVSKQDCELACDEKALKLLGEEERISYGKTLIGLIQITTKPKDYFSMTTTMTGSGKNIKKRVMRIANKPKTLLSVCGAVAFVAVLGLFCTITAGENTDSYENPEEAVSLENTASTFVSDTETTYIMDDNSWESSEVSAEDIAYIEENISEGHVYEEEEDMLDIEDANIIDNTSSTYIRNLTDEELTEEFDKMLLNTEEYTILVESISRSAKVIDRYRLNGNDYQLELSGLTAGMIPWEYEEQYMAAALEGRIDMEALAFAEDCKYYRNILFDSFGIEKEEISFDDFAQIFEKTGSNCNIRLKDGRITEIVALTPYTGVAYAPLYIDHWFYEEFKTEEFYELKASYEADIYHVADASSTGEEKEVLEVYTGNVGDGDSGYVLVNVPGNKPFSIEAHTARAGWNNIYVTNIEGKDYILTLQIDYRDTYGAFTYNVYSFEEQTGEELAAIQLSGSIFSYDKESFSEEAFLLWADSMEQYLKNATLLLSTQEGEVRTEQVNEYEKYKKEALLSMIREYW